MSKLGKKPISIPKDTKVKVESGKLVMTGPKGSKELTVNDKIYENMLGSVIEQTRGGNIRFSPKIDRIF